MAADPQVLLEKSWLEFSLSGVSNNITSLGEGHKKSNLFDALNMKVAIYFYDNVLSGVFCV